MTKEPVEMYRPPIDAVNLAENRTRGIIRRWGKNIRSSILELAVSLYLQGIEDAANVLRPKE